MVVIVRLLLFSYAIAAAGAMILRANGLSFIGVLLAWWLGGALVTIGLAVIVDFFRNGRAGRESFDEEAESGVLARPSGQGGHDAKDDMASLQQMNRRPHGKAIARQADEAQETFPAERLQAAIGGCAKPTA